MKLSGGGDRGVPKGPGGLDWSIGDTGVGGGSGESINDGAEENAGGGDSRGGDGDGGEKGSGEVVKGLGTGGSGRGEGGSGGGHTVSFTLMPSSMHSTCTGMSTDVSGVC